MPTRVTSAIRMPLIAAIRLYQYLVSPLLGTNCRYAPGCSEYAVEALTRHGVLGGSWLALRRVARCHPWGGHGFDPVPPARNAHGGGAGRRPIP